MLLLRQAQHGVLRQAQQPCFDKLSNRASTGSATIRGLSPSKPPDIKLSRREQAPGYNCLLCNRLQSLFIVPEKIALVELIKELNWIY
jgi:hypothetical protein